MNDENTPLPLQKDALGAVSGGADGGDDYALHKCIICHRMVEEYKIRRYTACPYCGMYPFGEDCGDYNIFWWNGEPVERVDLPPTGDSDLVPPTPKPPWE